jgi:hypothetical protein
MNHQTDEPKTVTCHFCGAVLEREYGWMPKHEKECHKADTKS